MKIPGIKSPVRKWVKRLVREETGFTLLEGMAATVVLAIGIIGVASMQDVVIKANSKSDQISAATNVLEQKAEELRGLSYIQSEINSGIFNRTNASQSAVAAKLDELDLGAHYTFPNCLKVNEQGKADANGSFCVSWTITDLTSAVHCAMGNCSSCSNTSATSGFCIRQVDIIVYFGKPFFSPRQVSVSTRLLQLAPDQVIKVVP